MEIFPNTNVVQRKLTHFVLICCSLCTCEISGCWSRQQVSRCFL